MKTNLLTVIISGSISILVVVLSQLLIKWREYNLFEKTETRKIQAEYINPLRYFLCENYNRLSEIAKTININENRKNDNLLIIKDTRELLDKDLNWFSGYGCYLISSCYFTACLFALIEHIRMGIPFIKLSSKDDTYLMNLITKISIDYSINLNIYYVIQMNIGEEVYIRNEQRVISYREFCNLLQDSDNLPWFTRLIDFYIKIGNGSNIEIINLLLKHLKELTGFLDKVVSGGDTLNQRSIAEFECKQYATSWFPKNRE